MTVTGATTAGASAPTGRSADLATPRHLWVITACCVVATVGLSGDIARHLQTGTSLTGDFWASWHLVLYAGVTGLALYLGWLAVEHGTPAVWHAFGPTVAGVFVLGAGGMGDWAWHSAFGVEVEIEALVSPPHLLLLIGLVLVLLGPIACLWRGTAERLDVSSTFVVGICVTSVTVVVMLFTGYLSLFASDVVVNGYANPMVGTRLTSTEMIHGIATVLWTSLVLTVPWLLLRLRWPHRPGMIATSFAVLAVASSQSVPGVAPEVVSSTLVAGVLVDLVVSVVTRGWPAEKALPVVAVAVPVLLWPIAFLSLDMRDRLEWGPTPWVGATALACLATVSVAGCLVLARRSAARPQARVAGR